MRIRFFVNRGHCEDTFFYFFYILLALIGVSKFQKCCYRCHIIFNAIMQLHEDALFFLISNRKLIIHELLQFTFYLSTPLSELFELYINGFQKFVMSERFCEIIIGTKLHSVSEVVPVCQCSEENKWDFPSIL